MSEVNNNNNRQSLKDLTHMKNHLESAKALMRDMQTHIDLVENYLIASMKREQEARRKEDKGGTI